MNASICKPTMLGAFKKIENFDEVRISRTFFDQYFLFCRDLRVFSKKIKKILRTDFYFNRAKMYENDWWTERLPLLRPSAGFKPRKFPLHREKAWLTNNRSFNKH